jgi:hypothetical protein
MAISKRNSRIGELLDTKKFSYAVIAEKVGTTRNAVAGVAFRRRHPYPTLIRSANSDGANMLIPSFPWRRMRPPRLSAPLLARRPDLSANLQWQREDTRTRRRPHRTQRRPPGRRITGSF